MFEMLFGQKLPKEFSAVRPEPREGQILSVSEIIPGLKVRQCSEVEGEIYVSDTVLVLTSKPFMDENGYPVTKGYEKKPYGKLVTLALADSGVIPYSDGKWNIVNWLAKVEPAKVQFT